MEMRKRAVKENVVSVTLVIVLCLNTIFWSLFGGLLSIFNRKGDLAHICNRRWARLNLFFGRYKIALLGMENLQPTRTYVLVSNHLSMFDIVMLLGLLPIQFRFVSKRENFRVPFLGWAMRFARYIEIERGRLKAAKKTLVSSANVLNKGISVAIFPEATRSKDGRIQPFSRGAFQLALKGGVPVLPITIVGTKRAISQNGLYIVPCPVKMIISTPIEATNYKLSEARRLMEDTRRVIAEQYERYCYDYYPFKRVDGEDSIG